MIIPNKLLFSIKSLIKNNPPKYLADNVQGQRGPKLPDHWLRKYFSTEQSKLEIVSACTKT